MVDFLAIHKAYPNVISIDGETKKAFDKDWKEISIQQSKVDAARVELNKAKYKLDRTELGGSNTYDTLSNQLDMLYHDLVAGKLDATGEWAKHIKAVKDANPKP